MTQFQGKSHKKFTGGKRVASRTKKRHELGREPTLPRTGPESRSIIRTHGGSNKVVLRKSEFANLYVPAEKKMYRAHIVTVKSNPANPHYVQGNIMNLGTVIETDKGLARITSRPGQSGIINAVLL